LPHKEKEALPLLTPLCHHQLPYPTLPSFPVPSVKASCSKSSSSEVSGRRKKKQGEGESLGKKDNSLKKQIRYIQASPPSLKSQGYFPPCASNQAAKAKAECCFYRKKT
jgi:hypothetical protein